MAGLKDSAKDAITISTGNDALARFDDSVKVAITIDNKLDRRQVKTSTDESSNSKSSTFFLLCLLFQ